MERCMNQTPGDRLISASELAQMGRKLDAGSIE